MSRSWQALRALRLRLFGPAKELVGTDQFGNKYYRVPEHEARAGRHRGPPGRPGGAQGCLPAGSRPGAWRAGGGGGCWCWSQACAGSRARTSAQACCLCPPPGSFCGEAPRHRNRESNPEPPAGSAEPRRSAVLRGSVTTVLLSVDSVAAWLLLLPGYEEERLRSEGKGAAAEGTEVAAGSYRFVQTVATWFRKQCVVTAGPIFLSGCTTPKADSSQALYAEHDAIWHVLRPGEVFHPPDHFCGPPLDPLQQVHVFPVLRAPELDAVLQVGSHQSGGEGQNHLPGPAGHASFDAPQDAIDFLGCECTLPGHVELLINRHPQVLLLRAALNPFPSQPVFVLGIAPIHVQGLELGFVEPREPVKVPVDVIPALQCVSHTTQLGVVSKLAEGALSPTVHVADRVKQHQSRHLSLLNGHQAIDCNSLSATIQPIPYPLSGPSIKSMFLQFRDKDVLWDSVKCYTQVQQHRLSETINRQIVPERRFVEAINRQAYQYEMGDFPTEWEAWIRKKRKDPPTIEGWRLHHFPGQPGPMLDNPSSEDIFPNIQSKPPLAQLEAISSCPITCYLGEETDPHLSTTSFQAKQSQLPQPLLIRLLLQTLHQLRCPSLDTLQHLNVPLVVGGPKLNTVFEVRPHQCRVQGHDHFPSPAGHAISDTSQDAIGLLGRLGTLLAHIQAAGNQHPQVLLCQAAFQPLFPKPVALHGVAVAHVQDFALGLVEPHTIGLGPSIQPVQVPLQSLPTLQQINTPAQLGVICKLTEGALDPFIQIIDKDIKQNWPQHSALGNTACDRPPTGFNSIYHNSLGLVIQTVFHTAKSTPIQAMSSQFLQENAEILKNENYREEMKQKIKDVSEKDKLLQAKEYKEGLVAEPVHTHVKGHASATYYGKKEPSQDPTSTAELRTLPRKNCYMEEK
ncbi:hypothetical protein QYF61_011070 [Mycteria americana]|uniref:Uncharacterized protein n=1 Tax=Mycteria americana TaxID=33587 RepID=A0AAN7RT48_MYCAM|nr:hypothetical protein QYF61_011070 [Mycteria americana]